MICIARIDFACGGNGTDETLTMTVGRPGTNGWDGLDQAAELRPDDDENCDGYLVEAIEINPVTGLKTRGTQWGDLCQDQVERVESYVQGAE